MVPCDNVLDVPNGKRSPTEGSVTCGTKVTYTCNEEFTLEGDSVLQCGIGGKLQGQVPVCRGSGNSFKCLSDDLLSSKNVPDVSNGKRSPTEDNVTCGTKVTYSCNEVFLQVLHSLVMKRTLGTNHRKTVVLFQINKN